jgi:hypothetical protein
MKLCCWVLLSLCFVAQMSCVNGQLGGAGGGSSGGDFRDFVIISFLDTNETMGFALPPKGESTNYSVETSGVTGPHLINITIAPLKGSNLNNYYYKISRDGKPVKNVSIREPIESIDNTSNIRRSITAIVAVLVGIFVSFFLTVMVNRKRSKERR